MVRLRFKQDGRHLVSPVLLVGEQFATVYIDPVLLVYDIKDSTNGMILFSGQADTLAECKKQAKNTLRAMGCSFNDEIRSKNKLELT